MYPLILKRALRSEMLELVVKYVLLLALALAAPAALAQGVAPDALLRAVTFEVIDKIKQDQEHRRVDPAIVAALIQTRILPLFDFARMTRLAMAHNWRLATPEQQRVLTEEFKTMMVRSYSAALTHYRGEIIDVKKLRTAALGNEVMVRSEVKQAGKEPMTLDYQMERTATGWKIYDVKVAGVSVVSTHRDVFAEKVREGGVDGLIKFLANENRGGGSRFNSIKNSIWDKSRVIYTIFKNVLQWP
jgi:phospholipid transport system substrate-binding protein